MLNFAFGHLLISGVSCYSCLWLEPVPPVILLASVSSPGSPALFWVSVVRVISSGQAFLLQGRCTEVWRSDLPPDWRWRPETGPVPEDVLPLQCAHSPAQTGLWGTQDTRWLPHLLWWSEPFQAATSLVGKVPRCLEPRGLSQKLCGFCSLHSHLCRLVSEGPGTQDGSLLFFFLIDPFTKSLYSFTARFFILAVALNLCQTNVYFWARLIDNFGNYLPTQVASFVCLWWHLLYRNFQFSLENGT
jgi:hypothetical protein